MGVPRAGGGRWLGRSTTSSSSAAGPPAARSANRLSADPSNRVLVLEAGRAGLPLGRLHPHAGGADVPDREPLLRLEVRVRARAAHARPAHLPRARQGAGRLEQHQRDDLPAREPARLRTVGAPTAAWRRGTTRTASRTSSAWRTAWRPRWTTRTAATRARWSWSGDRPTNPLFGAFFEAVQQAGLRADRRRERLPAGGLRSVRPQRAPGPPAVGGPRVPAPDRWTGRNLQRAHAGVRAPRAVRGHARRRGRVRLARPPAHGPRRRGHPVRAARSTRRRRCRCRGVGNADELRALGIDVVHDLPGVGEHLQDHLEVYVQYACTQPVSMAPYLKWRRRPLGRVPVAVLPRRPRRDEPLRGRRLRAQQRRRARTRT